MAETVQRRVDIQITGSDNGASAALKGVGQAAQQMASQVKSASLGGGGGGADTGMVFGPAVRSRFDADTQLVRDKIAGRIRAMRDAARRAAQEEKINDYLFGAPAAAAPTLPGLSAGDFGRGSASPRTKAVAATREESAIKKLAREGEEFNKLTNIIRGGGAVVALSQLGQALQRLPEVLAKWEQSMLTGGSATERYASLVSDAVPVVGDLAKGFRTLWDEISGQGKAERERLREEADRKQLEQMRERRDAARKPILDAAAEGAVEGRYRLRLAGKTGQDLEREAARVDLEREMRAIAEQRRKVSTFGDDERQKAEANLNTRAAAARAEYTAKIQAMDQEANKKTIEDSRKKREWDIQSEELVRQKAAEGRQLDLENQGRYLTAKLEAVKTAADEELAALKKKHEEETRALEADPVSGRAASSVRDNAQRRMKAEEEAVRANQKRQEKAIQEQDAREREQAAQEHAGRLQDVQTNLAARRLQMEGQGEQAQQLVAKRAYQKRLEDIQKNLDDQIKAHKEREPELRAQAKEAATAAARDYALTQEEIARQREQAFQIGLPGGVANDSPLKGLIGPLGLAGGAGSPADRTAKATEKASVELGKINKGIERMEKALGNLQPAGVITGN